jgi:hypothetical protein
VHRVLAVAPCQFIDWDNQRNPIIAGSDTTSGALRDILCYLSCNPAADARLQAKVDNAFPTVEEPLDVTKLS